MNDTLSAWEALRQHRFIPSKKDKIKHIWGPYLPERTTVVLYGPKGTAKSPFAKALCTAISKGQPFLGIPTRQRRVLYWDMENPRAALVRQDRQMKLGIASNEWLTIWTYFKAPEPRLHSEANTDLEKAAREIYKKTGQTLLIVLDHWQQFLKSDASGLEPGETKGLIRNLQRLVKAGATVLIIGHPTGSGKKMYGFGTESIDVNLRWVEDKSSFKMQIERSRLGETGELSIQQILEFKNGKPIYRGFRVAKNATIEIMRSVIAANPALGQDELATKGARALTDAGIKTGRDKVKNEVLKRYNRKEWLAERGEHGKVTYTLISADGPRRFPRS